MPRQYLGPKVSWVPTTDQRAAERSKDSEQESIIRAFYRLQQPEAGTETRQGTGPAVTDPPADKSTHLSTPTQQSHIQKRKFYEWVFRIGDLLNLLRPFFNIAAHVRAIQKLNHIC